MNRAVLGLATDRGVMVLKPGTEANDYKLSTQGILSRKCACITRVGDGQIAAGTEDFFVQLSKDGQNWKPSLDGLNRKHITCLARHPKHSQLLFAGTSSPAVYLSSDHGASWKALAPLESLPTASRWTASKAPFLASVSAITCHPEHAGVLFAAIEIGGLAASKDGGKEWFSRDDGLPPDLRFLIAPPVAGRLYAGTGAGVYRSDDLGGNWYDCNKGLPYTEVKAMTVAASNPDLILISVAARNSTFTTLLQSKNGGKSWDVSNQGLPRLDNRTVTCLTFGRGGFYAGTDKGDLFGLDNLEGRWTRLGAQYPPINALVALA